MRRRSGYALCVVVLENSPFFACRREQDARRQRTIRSNIAHGIGPVLVLLVRALVFPQLPGEMPDDGVRLRQDAAVELHDGYGVEGVHLLELGLFEARVLVKAVAHVGVGDTGVLPEKADDLTAALAGEVEVVDGRDAADGFVGGARGAVLLGGDHFEDDVLCL